MTIRKSARALTVRKEVGKLPILINRTLKAAKRTFKTAFLKDSHHAKNGISLTLYTVREDLPGGGDYYKFEAFVIGRNKSIMYVGVKEEYETCDMFPWHTFGNVAPWMDWSVKKRTV